MKKIWLIVLSILTIGLWSNSSFALDNFKPGSEPGGFRDIKWGTDISTLKDMEYLRTDQGSAGEIKVYIRKNDDLHIGAAKLEGIEYGFWGGKFFNVTILTEGYVNWCGLRDAIFEKFGRGSQDKFVEICWEGSITYMILEYNEILGAGWLLMFSEEIGKQVEAYEKQKAKEKGVLSIKQGEAEKIKIGFLTILVQPYSEKGVLLKDFHPNLPSETLQRGDIIIELNGKKITNLKELQIGIRDLESTNKFSIVVIRNKKAISLKLGIPETEAEKQNRKIKPIKQLFTKEEWERMKKLGIVPGREKEIKIGELDLERKERRDCWRRARTKLLSGIVKKVEHRGVRSTLSWRPQDRRGVTEVTYFTLYDEDNNVKATIVAKHPLNLGIGEWLLVEVKYCGLLSPYSYKNRSYKVYFELSEVLMRFNSYHFQTSN